MSPRTYRPSVHPNNRWPDGTGLLIGATNIWSVTQFALLTMLGATNLNQFTWSITAVQNIFMVFRKAIFVLRVLVNQDKKFMDPSALLSSWFTRQTVFFVLKYPLCQQYFVHIYKNAGGKNLLLCLYIKSDQELWRIDCTGIDWAYWEPIDFSK